MSTPVATLWDDILMLPIVGLIDSKRANDIMTSALRRISETRAKVFIMDISGVSVIDTAVANHLIQVTRATRLMGCQSLLSGVSPAIAQTMVELGIDVGSVQTKTTLRDALEDAFRNVGVMVQRI
jgi:rsbT co-antagonist protein RsbR